MTPAVRPEAATTSRASARKLGAAAAVAALLAAQRMVGVYAPPAVKLPAGHVLSLALAAAVILLAAPGEDGPDDDRWPPASACVLFSALLAVNAFSAKLAFLLLVPPTAPPAVPLAALVGLWLLLLVWYARRKMSAASLAVGLAILVAGTRLLAVRSHPFHKLDADMLATIGRGLDALFAGRFPYADGPPPMPYLPATFLAYAPARLMGVDLRWTNLAFAAATALAVVLACRPAGGGRAPHLGQLLLPALMLHPVWVVAEADTQYAPTVLATALLGLAVARGGLGAQAIALGGAVATNQMLGALGPILLARWAGRWGWPRALGASASAAGLFLATIAPFLIWDPRRFLDVVFFSRPSLGDAMLAGRFTLLPAASRLIPHASLVGSLACLGAASRAALRARTPAGVLTAMAGGLCGALLFQPVSFGHYFLPAVALAAVASCPCAGEAREGGGPPA